MNAERREMLRDRLNFCNVCKNEECKVQNTVGCCRRKNRLKSPRFICPVGNFGRHYDKQD